MLIQSDKGLERLSSGSNLFNRLRGGLESSKRNNSMGLFTRRIENSLDAKTQSAVKPALELPTFNTPAIIPEVLPAETSTTAPAVTADELLSDIDSKIKLEAVAKDALSCLHEAVVQLRNNINHMNPARLPDVATKMSKVIADIRERQGDRDEKPVHLHFYAPERKKLEDYREVAV